MAEERNFGPQGAGGQRDNAHQVQVRNREQVQVSGVLHVDSFDDRQIVLDTDLGTLTIQGEDLQIKQLDLESGKFAVTGLVSGLNYSAGIDRERRGKGFFERLLR